MVRSSGSGANKPVIALCTIAFREKLLEDALDAAAELGFQAVELWGREPHVGDEYDYNRVRLARKLCQERGLEIVALGSYVRFAPTKRSSGKKVDIKQTLLAARTLRAPIVRVWASDIGSDQADDQLWRAAISEARQAAEQAAKLGLTLAIEMHDDTLADTADSALRIIEEVGSEALRLNYQPSAREGMEDPVERLEKVLPYVVHVHAQNFAKLAKRDGSPPARAPLGMGLIDYEQIVSLLLANGYNGAIAVEFAHVEGEGKKAALRNDLQFLTELLDKLA